MKQMPSQPTKKQTQVRQIYHYLSKGHTIRPIQAWAMFRVYRLADVIYKLKARSEGKYTITTTMKTEGDDRFAEYKMEMVK